MRFFFPSSTSSVLGFGALLLSAAEKTQANGNDYCLRIQTGPIFPASGYLRVWIDSGNGYIEEINGNFYYYDYNSIVVAGTTCFSNQFSVQVQNTYFNGWVGSIERSIDGGNNWAPMVCADQCTVLGGSTSPDFIVDGNYDAWQFQGCVNGALCTLTMFAGVPVSVCIS